MTPIERYEYAQDIYFMMMWATLSFASFVVGVGLYWEARKKEPDVAIARLVVGAVFTILFSLPAGWKLVDVLNPEGAHQHWHRFDKIDGERQ